MNILRLLPFGMGARTNGGQQRCYHLGDQLRRAGHDVHDVVMNNGDVLQSTDYPFDAIMFEFPWLVHTAQWLIKQHNNAAKLVYSSHHIEVRVQLERLGRQPDYCSDSWTEYTARCERKAYREADLVVCCSVGDAEYFQASGARRVVVAGNGAEPFTYTIGQITEAHRVIGPDFHRRTPFYVSSSWVPNAHGFWDMLAGMRLEPREKIAVIGGARDVLLQDRFMPAGADLVAPHLWMLGVMESRQLEAYLCAANVNLLPITAGGGSSLKVAQALLAPRPILATRQAFRGFEFAMGDKRVILADTPAQFQEALRDLYSGSYIPDAEPADELKDRLTWSSMLAPLVEQFHALAAGPEA